MEALMNLNITLNLVFDKNERSNANKNDITVHISEDQITISSVSDDLNFSDKSETKEKKEYDMLDTNEDDNDTENASDKAFGLAKKPFVPTKHLQKRGLISFLDEAIEEADRELENIECACWVTIYKIDPRTVEQLVDILSYELDVSFHTVAEEVDTLPANFPCISVRQAERIVECTELLNGKASIVDKPAF